MQTNNEPAGPVEKKKTIQDIMGSHPSQRSKRGENKSSAYAPAAVAGHSNNGGIAQTKVEAGNSNMQNEVYHIVSVKVADAKGNSQAKQNKDQTQDKEKEPSVKASEPRKEEVKAEPLGTRKQLMLQFKVCAVEEASPRLDQRNDPNSIQQNVDVG